MDINPEDLAEAFNELRVPILAPYRAVLEGNLSIPDQGRLIQLKKAADVVYNYFEWVATDHRRVEDEKQHTARIESLLQEVMGFLGYSPWQKAIAGFFTVCVLTEIKEEFMAGGPSGTAFPVEIDTLKHSAFHVEDFIDGVAEFTPAETLFAAGIFVPLDYEIDDALQVSINIIRQGGTVFSDDTLTQTDDLQDMVEQVHKIPYAESDVHEQYDAIVFALKEVYTADPL